ncbi:MAG: type II secretion system F family protein [Chloroflexi bacterium]|nr:type II secretion system F family protein [Chloroflexota bacterium]
MLFKYTVYDQAGQRRIGTAEADTTQALEQRLWDANFIVAKISRVHRLPPLYEILPTLFSLKPSHIVSFTQQLVTLMRSGLPLVRSLDVFLAQSIHPQLKNTVRDMRQNLAAGTQFSLCLARHPKVFSPLFVSMVSVGEATGNLADMLERVAIVTERQIQMKSKLRSTLTYPMIVFVASLGALWLLIGYTIPLMAGLFTEFRAEMPLITRVILSGSALIRQLAPTFLMGLIALGLIGWLTSRSPRGALRRDRMFLRFPAIGQVIQKTQVAGFAETLSRIIVSGIPLVEALTITRDTIGGRLLPNAINDILGQVTTGRNFSQGLARHAYLFPSTLIEMDRVAEETGTIEKQLQVVAEVYQQEAERAIEQAVELLEPAIVLFVGLIVAVIGVAVLSTVYGVLPSIK